MPDGSDDKAAETLADEILATIHEALAADPAAIFELDLSVEALAELAGMPDPKTLDPEFVRCCVNLQEVFRRRADQPLKEDARVQIEVKSGGEGAVSLSAWLIGRP